MKKRFLLLTLIMCLLGGVNSLSLKAQDVVTIDGNGNNSPQYGDKGLFETYQTNTSSSQSIYTKEEIGISAGSTITHLAFKIDNTENTSRTIVVWLKNIAEVDFGKNNYQGLIQMSDEYKVFEGNFDLSQSGWNSIDLDDDFVYTGASLLVTVYDKTGEAGTGTVQFNMFYSYITDEGDNYWHKTRFKKNADPSTVTELNGTRYTPSIQITYTPGSSTPTGPTPPTLVSPDDESIVNNKNVYLIWDYGEDNTATQYKVLLGKDRNNLSEISGTVENRWVARTEDGFATEDELLIEDLEYGEKYYWRVDVKDGEDNIEEGTTVRSFTVPFIFNTNGNWNVPSNWEGGNIPDDNDVVLINAAATIPSGLTLTPGNIVFGINGSLTIAEGGQLISDQEDLEVTVQKEITGYESNEDGWYTISSPIAGNLEINGVGVSGILDGDYDLYRYDEEDYEWENQKDVINLGTNPFEVLEPGRGYLYANDDNITLEFTGAINTEDVTYHLSAKENGINLIGNPFTHNIYMNQTMFNDKHIIEIEMNDAGSNGKYDYIEIYENGNATPSFYGNFINKTSVIEVGANVELSVKYIRDIFHCGYPEMSNESLTIRYKYGGEIICEFKEEDDDIAKIVGENTEVVLVENHTTPESITQPVFEGYYTLSNNGGWQPMLAVNIPIAPCQGILVKANADADLTIRKDATAPAAKRSSQPSISINVANEKYNDVAYATFGKGVGLDKIEHRNANIPTIAIPVDGIDYAIAVLDEDVNEIPVHFEAMTMGFYTISVNAQNFKSDELTLVDLKTGENINMLEGGYTFMATTTDDVNRFYIRLGSDQQSANSNFVYQSGEDLIIEAEGTVQIIDMMGRVVYTSNVENNNRINVSDFNNGAYVVRVINENEVKVEKVVIY